MTRNPAPGLRALAILLAVYLCAPFIASAPQLGRADWRGFDWRPAGAAIGVSDASASLATALILLCGAPLAYWLARSRVAAL